MGSLIESCGRPKTRRSGPSGTPNPLAGHPYVPLRDSYANALAKGGVAVPSGTSPYLYADQVCAPQPRTAVCQNALAAVSSSTASAVRPDASSSGTLPGVPPGIYYLMISARVNNQMLLWSQPVTLHAGANSILLTTLLTTANAQPLR